MSHHLHWHKHFVYGQIVLLLFFAVPRQGFGELHDFTSGTTERFAVLRNVHLTAMKWIAI